MSDLLREIIISVILLAGVVILSHMIGFLWRNVFKKIALKTPTKLDLILFETTEKPIFYLILVGGFYLVIRRFEEYVQIGKTIGARIIDSVFFTSAVIVVNYSYPNPKIKIRQVISVAYGSDLEKVKKILMNICTSHEKVLKNPVPEAFFTEFGESSLNLLMIC